MAAAQPGFDCQRARTAVERLVCSDADLARADARMSAAYTALALRWDEDRSLRRTQRRWLRERNACGADAACVAAAYAAHNTVLEQALAKVPDLGPFPWTTAPAGSAWRIERIDDTRVLRITIPAAAQRRTLQWEFYPDPDDHRHLFTGGPYTEVSCRPPDAREGYAPRFSFHKRRAGPAIAPITRGARSGYRLMRMTLGEDLPLGEEIRCSFVFSGWVLDRGSELVLVPVDAPATMPR
ncbi:lysozyme inhibitor LprI family protein [Rubrivivax gelatinosus]|uniref:lysozyme inhibitor LprI family protein n=1 Tax=Rubrivivax gelatinosus TaxID=28068 RepID=UPI003A80EA9E